LKPKSAKNETKGLTFKKTIDSYRKWKAEGDFEEETAKIEIERNFVIQETFSEPGDNKSELNLPLENLTKLREKEIIDHGIRKEIIILMIRIFESVLIE
jgi:hypothetical protein